MTDSNDKKSGPNFNDALAAAKAAKSAKKDKAKKEASSVSKKHAPHAINPHISGGAKAHVPQMVRRSKKGG